MVYEWSEIAVGDLVQTAPWGPGIVVEADTKTEGGRYWWRVYLQSRQRYKIIGEWELTILI